MTRFWSVSLIFLLTLPFAAPANAPIPSEVRWQDGPAMIYRVRAGDTLAGLAERGLSDAARVLELAAANGLAADARLRPGQSISIPSGMLRRDMVTARVVSFAGVVNAGDGTPLRLDSELVEGDIVQTGSNSHVTLDMGPAGRVTLPSQSRVRIAALHRVALTGEIERRLEPVKGETDWLLGRLDLGSGRS